MKKVIAGFVKRQTPESRFSHFDGTWEELEEMVERQLSRATQGYRKGVMLVGVPARGFFSSVVTLTPETALRAKFEARREGEKPYIVIEAVDGEKSEAHFVEVVIYHRDVLAEEGEVTHDAEWEIISINARRRFDPEPMTPMAMARNMLELPGGTKAEYTAQQFAESIVYWNQHAMLGQS